MAEKTELEIQIDREAEELKNAPKIPIVHGSVRRCHLCGAVYSHSELKPFDTHVIGEIQREACPNCHPNRDVT